VSGPTDPSLTGTWLTGTWPPARLARWAGTALLAGGVVGAIVGTLTLLFPA